MRKTRISRQGRKIVSAILALVLTLSLLPIGAATAAPGEKRFIGEPADNNGSPLETYDGHSRTRESVQGAAWNSASANNPAWRVTKSAAWVDKSSYKANLDFHAGVRGAALGYAYDMILVTDRSGSMWSGGMERINNLREAVVQAITVFQESNSANRVAYVSFSADVRNPLPLTNKKLSRSEIEGIYNADYASTGHGTSWTRGVQMALDIFTAENSASPYYKSVGVNEIRVPVLVFMTDGLPNNDGGAGGAHAQVDGHPLFGLNTFSVLALQPAGYGTLEYFTNETNRKHQVANPFYDYVLLNKTTMFEVTNVNAMAQTFRSIVEGLANFEVVRIEDKISDYYDIDWSRVTWVHDSGPDLRTSNAVGQEAVYKDTNAAKGYLYKVTRQADGSYDIIISFPNSAVTSKGYNDIVESTVDATIPVIVKESARGNGDYLETNDGEAHTFMLATELDNGVYEPRMRDVPVNSPELFVGTGIYVDKTDVQNWGAPGDRVDYVVKYTNTTDAGEPYFSKYIKPETLSPLRIADMLPPELYYDANDPGAAPVSIKVYDQHETYTPKSGVGAGGVALPVETVGAGTNLAVSPVFRAVRDGATGKWREQIVIENVALKAGQTIEIIIPAKMLSEYWTFNGASGSPISSGTVSLNGGAIARSALNVFVPGAQENKNAVQIYDASHNPLKIDDWEDTVITAQPYAFATNNAEVSIADTGGHTLLPQPGYTTEKTLLMPYIRAYYNINNADLVAKMADIGINIDEDLPRDQYLGTATGKLGYQVDEAVPVESWQPGGLDRAEQQYDVPTEDDYSVKTERWQFLGWTLDGAGAGSVYSREDAVTGNDVYTSAYPHDGDVVFNAQWAKLTKHAKPSQSKDDRFLNIGDTLTYQITLTNDTEAAIRAAIRDTVPRGAATVSAPAPKLTVYNSGGGLVSSVIAPMTEQYNAATRMTSLAFQEVSIPAGGYAVAEFSVRVVAETVNGVVNAPSELMIHNKDVAATVVLPNAGWEYDQSTGAKEFKNGAYDYAEDIVGPETKNAVTVKSSDAPARGLHVGEVVRYTLLFTNNGKEADSVYLRDELPYGLQYTGNVEFWRGLYPQSTNEYKFEAGIGADSQAITDGHSQGTFTATVHDLAPGDFGFVAFDATVTADAVDPAKPSTAIWKPDNYGSGAHSKDTKLDDAAKAQLDPADFADPRNGYYATLTNSAWIKSDKEDTLPTPADNTGITTYEMGNGWHETNYVTDRVKPNEKLALAAIPGGDPAAVDYSIGDTVDVASLAVGSTFYYFLSEMASKFRSENSFIPDSADAAPNVTVHIYDAIPDGLAYEGEAAAYGTGGSVQFYSSGSNGYVPARDRFGGGYLEWTFANVADDTPLAGSFKVRVVRDASVAGIIENTYDIAIGDRAIDGGMSNHHSTAVGEKVSDAGADGVHEGDTVTYTIRVTNDTGATSPITIRDRAPAHTQLVAGSYGAQGVLETDGWIYWTFTDVPVGAQVTVSFKVIVEEGAADALQLSRRADATFFAFYHALNSNAETENGDVTPRALASSYADEVRAEFKGAVAAAYALKAGEEAKGQFAAFAYAHGGEENGDNATYAAVNYGAYIGELAADEYGRFVGRARLWWALRDDNNDDSVIKQAPKQYGGFIGYVASKQYGALIGDAAAAQYYEWYDSLSIVLASSETEVIEAYKAGDVTGLVWDGPSDYYPIDSDAVTYPLAAQEYGVVTVTAATAYAAGAIADEYKSLASFTDSDGYADDTGLLVSGNHDDVVETAADAYKNATALDAYKNLSVESVDYTNGDGYAIQDIVDAIMMEFNYEYAVRSLEENLAAQEDRLKILLEDKDSPLSQMYRAIVIAAKKDYINGAVPTASSGWGGGWGGWSPSKLKGDDDKDGLPDDGAQYPLASISYADAVAAATAAYDIGGVSAYQGLGLDLNYNSEIDLDEKTDTNDDGYPDDADMIAKYPYAPYPKVFYEDKSGYVAYYTAFAAAAAELYESENDEWPLIYWPEVAADRPEYDDVYYTEYPLLVHVDTLNTYAELLVNARQAFIDDFAGDYANYAIIERYWDHPEDPEDYWNFWKSVYDFDDDVMDGSYTFNFIDTEYDAGTASSGGLSSVGIDGWFGYFTGDAGSPGTSRYEGYFGKLPDEQYIPGSYRPPMKDDTVGALVEYDSEALTSEGWNVWDVLFYERLTYDEIATNPDYAAALQYDNDPYYAHELFAFMEDSAIPTHEHTNGYWDAFEAYIRQFDPLSLKNRAQKAFAAIVPPHVSLPAWADPAADANGYPWRLTHLDGDTSEYEWFGYSEYPAPTDSNPWLRTNETRDPIIIKDKNATGVPADPNPPATPPDPPFPPFDDTGVVEQLFDDNTAHAIPGDRINWRIRFGNRYPEPLTVSVRDIIPEHTEYLDGSWKLLRIKDNVSLPALLADPGNPIYYEEVVSSDTYDPAERLTGNEFDGNSQDTYLTVTVSRDAAGKALSLTWAFTGFPSGTQDKYVIAFTTVVLDSARVVDEITNVATITVGNDRKDTSVDRVAIGQKQSDAPLGGVYRDDDGTASIGYTVNFTNPAADDGSGEPATLVIIDPVPAGVTYREDSLSIKRNNGADWYTMAGDLAEYAKYYKSGDPEYDGSYDVYGKGYVRFIVKNAAPGESGSVAFGVTTIPASGDATIRNRALILTYTYDVGEELGYDPSETDSNGDPIEPKPTNETVDTVHEQVKQSDYNGDNPATIGEMRKFTITYTLPSDLAQFSITDDMPNYTELVDSGAYKVKVTKNSVALAEN
ncbi:MAG: DUF11 domain-containing protein, partial [Oscillospiraceae bacterium]|nr:DUF11 domain-containing protein [Oscillospiraceae bacterium]